MVPETQATNYLIPGELLRSWVATFQDMGWGYTGNLTRALIHALDSAYQTAFSARIRTWIYSYWAIPPYPALSPGSTNARPLQPRKHATFSISPAILIPQDIVLFFLWPKRSPKIANWPGENVFVVANPVHLHMSQIWLLTELSCHEYHFLIVLSETWHKIDRDSACQGQGQSPRVLAGSTFGSFVSLDLED